MKQVQRGKKLKNNEKIKNKNKKKERKNKKITYYVMLYPFIQKYKSSTIQHGQYEAKVTTN